MDLGTGSEILALAAAKWGAEKVLAIDCNELAVETTLRNVSSNEESQRIEVRMGKAEDFIEEEADLVCANIHLQIIESLLKKRPFSRRDAEEIERRLIQGSVEIVQRLQEKNWLTHSRRRQAPPFRAVCKAPLRVNPEPAPAFMLGSRRVDPGRFKQYRKVRLKNY